MYPEPAAYDDAGQVKTGVYQKLNSLLLNELQKQNRQIPGLEERLADLTERLARLEQ